MALRIITHCYSYLRNITHIEEEMSNLWDYAIWLILRIWSIFSQAPQQAHRTFTNQQQPTRAPAGVLLSIPIPEHLGGEDSGAGHRAATQNAIYSISLRNSTYCVVWRFHATKLCIVSHYTWNSRGDCPPPRVLCVMMSKKEIYEQWSINHE